MLSKFGVEDVFGYCRRWMIMSGKDVILLFPGLTSSLWLPGISLYSFDSDICIIQHKVLKKKISG